MIGGSREFGQWPDGIEEQGRPALRWALAMLADLQDLDKRPPEESATYKRVRQARRHELWRVGHPFDEHVAVRLICWFPDDSTVVVALVGFDKARHGDIWYTSAALRGEALVDQWLREHGQGQA